MSSDISKKSAYRLHTTNFIVYCLILLAIYLIFFALCFQADAVQRLEATEGEADVSRGQHRAPPWLPESGPAAGR